MKLDLDSGGFQAGRREILSGQADSSVGINAVCADAGAAVNAVRIDRRRR